MNLNFLLMKLIMCQALVFIFMNLVFLVKMIVLKFIVEIQAFMILK